MPTAGQMIQAGDVARVIWWWEHAGRGAVGWQYATDRLSELHPDAAANSIAAVIRVAQETTDVGNRYRHGNPGYAPPPSVIPDARPLEPSPAGGGVGAGGRRRSTYRHEGIITIFDEGAGGRTVQVFNVTIDSSTILTRQQFEDALRAQFPELARNSPSFPLDELEREYELDYEIRIEGVFRTFP